MARHPELEAAILADRGDPELYRVYGDWLEQQGDPRGALIALHLANETTQARTLLSAHPELLPQPRSSWGAVFEWTNGFLGAIDLVDPSIDDFATVLHHPSCALLRSLQVSISGDFAADLIGQISHHVSPLEHLAVHHTVIGFGYRNLPPIGDDF